MHCCGATLGIRSCLSEVAKPQAGRKTILLSYGWKQKGSVSPVRRANLLVARQAARFARCLVLMTHEQVLDARAALPETLPVVQLRVGIDTHYYQQSTPESDVPEEHRAAVERLLKKPYLIMTGDELRLNQDALQVAQETGLQLVRVSQYGYKSNTAGLKEEVLRQGLGERLVVFERISYPFLRYLLQNAAAYVGFVDATWQPAGWTAACESLASGLPVVLYDGLVARELAYQGIPKDVMRVIPMGNRDAFAQELTTLVASPRNGRAITVKTVRRTEAKFRGFRLGVCAAIFRLL